MKMLVVFIQLTPVQMRLWQRVSLLYPIRLTLALDANVVLSLLRFSLPDRISQFLAVRPSRLPFPA
jgi:hypothetical protein